MGTLIRIIGSGPGWRERVVLDRTFSQALHEMTSFDPDIKYCEQDERYFFFTPDSDQPVAIYSEGLPWTS